MQQLANLSNVVEIENFRQPNLHHCAGYIITFATTIVLKLIAYTLKTNHNGVGHLKLQKLDEYWLGNAKICKSQHDRKKHKFLPTRPWPGMGHRITQTSNIILKLITITHTPKTIYKSMGHLEWSKLNWYWPSYEKNGKSQCSRSAG